MVMDRKQFCFTCVLFLHFWISCVAVSLTNKTTPSTPENSRTIPDIASLCPYNRFCTSPPLKNIPNTTFRSCCQACSCDEGCYEIGTCCPDSPYTYAGDVKYPCKQLIGSTSDHNYDIDIDAWYHVIDNCKDKLKALIHPRCSKPTELEDLVAVSNEKSGRVYKNKHCALCNGEQNYTVWVLKVVCTDAFIHSFKTVEERNRHVFENRDKCPVYSVSPDDTTGEKSRCFPEFLIRSACNVTGRWDFYDKDIEEACLHIRNNQNVIYSVDKAPYSNVPFKYSNVYCYLCNIHRNSEKKDLCLPEKHNNMRTSSFLHFSAIIDSRHTEHAVQVSPCQLNEMWDQYSSVCRQLFCPDGTIPLYGRCDSIVSVSNGYSIALKFELDYDRQMVQIPNEELMSLLAKKVVPRLGSGCGLSTTDLKSTADLSVLYFELTIYSTDTCSVETMLTNARILAISKELRLKYRSQKKEIQILLRLNIDKKIILSEVIAYKTFIESKIRREIDYSILNYCPMIALTPQELNSYNISNRLDTASIKPDLENGTLTQSKTICIDEYFRIRQELSGGVANHLITQFIFFVFEIVFSMFYFM